MDFALPDRRRVSWPAALCVAAWSAATFVAPVVALRQSPPRVVKIVGETHKLLLRDDGSVAGWGQWREGQLGPIAPLAATRTVVERLIEIDLPGKAVDIAVGAATSFAVLDDGTVFGWGRGDGGQLGIDPAKRPLLSSSTTSSDYRGIERPTRIAGLTNVVRVASSDTAVYAVLADGTLRAWGSGNLGDGRGWRSGQEAGSPRAAALTPVEVSAARDIVSVSTAAGAVLALDRQGRVFSWGGNFYGMLGRPPREGPELDAPGEIPGLSDVADVAAGQGVSTALKKDGSVWVWGSNWMAQFGSGAQTAQPNINGGYQLEPQQVPGVTGVVEIAVGVTGRHTLARLKDGTLRFWGNNDWGQGGTGGGSGFVLRPVALKIAGVSRVFAAGNNSFAVKTDGSLWAWGAGGPTDFPLKSNVRLPALLVWR